MTIGMNAHRFATVTVSLQDREDGGLRVFSDDLPGLILSGPEKKDVIKGIVPAITAILNHSGLKDFSVHPSKSVLDILNGRNPQDVDMHVKRFVVEYLKAA
jgi:hypothetical protein